MFFLCFVVSALGLLSRAVAQSASSNWVVPDGTQADYAQTFINGSQLPVAWTGWNSTFTESMLHSSVTVANLWVTKVTSSDVFSQLLAENVAITKPGSYIWTINIDAAELALTAQYALRFVTAGEDFNNPFFGPPNIPSPAFIVLPGRSSTSLTSSTPSTSSNPSTSSTSPASSASTSTLTLSIFSPSSSLLSTPSIATTSSTLAQATLMSTSVTSASSALVIAPSTASTAKAEKGLKTSATVGIAVGSFIGGIAAIIVVVLALRRKRQSTLSPTIKYESQEESQEESPMHKSPVAEHRVELDGEGLKSELESKKHIVELEGTKRQRSAIWRA